MAGTFKFKLLLLFLAVVTVSSAQNIGEVNPQNLNSIKIQTCCDLGRDPGRRECPDVLKPPAVEDRLTQWEIPAKITLTGKRMPVFFTTQWLDCERKEFDLTLEEPLEIQVQPDGYLMLGNRNFADYIHPGSYCIDGISPTMLKIRTCPATCTNAEPCIRKCCQLHQLFDLHQEGRQRCVEQKQPSSPWTPKLFSKPANPATQLNLAIKPEVKPRILIRPPPSFQHNCQMINERPITQIMPYSKSLNLTPPHYDIHAFRARFGLDGKLFSRNLDRKWEAIPDEEYCSDGLTITTDESHVYTDTIEETVYILCGMKHEREEQASEYYAALAIACSIFALITVLVYFLLLEKQNIHGWTTMSHSSAVFFLFIFLGVAHLTKEHDHFHQTWACPFIGIIVHYFWIAVFCWLLVLSFDLWLTFRSISIASARRGCRRFLFYSIFGWGFPLLFVLFSEMMDRVYGSDEDTEVKVPMYGDSFCYLSRYALLEYLYLPCGILFVINMTFFLLTAWTLHRYQQSTKMATKNMQKNRQSFILFVKLFVVAGMLWVIELISFLVSGAHVPWYIQIFDTLNVLQPVFIFIIFVLKWEVINALHEKYVWLRPIVYPARALLRRFRRRGNISGLTHQESTALNSRANDTNISRVSNGNPEETNTNF